VKTASLHLCQLSYYSPFQQLSSQHSSYAEHLTRFYISLYGLSIGQL